MTISLLQSLVHHLDKVDAAVTVGHHFEIKSALTDASHAQRLAKGHSSRVAHYSRVALEILSTLSNCIFLGFQAEQRWKLLSIAVQSPQLVALGAIGAPASFIFGALGVIAVANKIEYGTFIAAKPIDTAIVPHCAGEKLFDPFSHAVRIVIRVATLFFTPTNPFLLFSTFVEISNLFQIKLTGMNEDRLAKIPLRILEKPLNLSVKDFNKSTRSLCISKHLSGENTFTISTYPLQTRYTSFDKTLSYHLGDANTWKLLASLILTYSLVVFTSFGKVTALIPKIYYSNLALLPAAYFLLRKTVTHIIKRHKAYRELQTDYSILLERTKVPERNLTTLSNQRVGNNRWQDPISFEIMDDKLIASPATLMIDNTAFLMESTLPLLFRCPEDSTQVKMPSINKELFLYHPVDLQPLSKQQQDSVIEQICRTFMITRSEFKKCWKTTRLVRFLMVHPKAFFDWCLDTGRISRQTVDSFKDDEEQFDPEKFYQAINEDLQFEFYEFLTKEKMFYYQLVRFITFAVFLPGAIRSRLAEQLPDEQKMRIRFMFDEKYRVKLLAQPPVFE